jgi:hypothetical protein
LRILHPTHVWQIDASLCVLYYLNPAMPKSAAAGHGIQPFYKNKPPSGEERRRSRLGRTGDGPLQRLDLRQLRMGAESGFNQGGELHQATASATAIRCTRAAILMMDMGAPTPASFSRICRAA